MCDHLHFGSQFHIKRNVSKLSQLPLRSNVKIVNHLTILTYLFIMFAMIVTSWFWCERKLCTNTAPISKLSLYAHVNLCVNRCTQENGIIVIGSCNSTFSNLLSTLIYHLPRLDGGLRHIRLYEFTNADEIVWN